jgi:hypothetical protein
MDASKNMLENNILKQLGIYHAVTDLKLFELVKHSDSEKDRYEYMVALDQLNRKGIIEVVSHATDSMDVIRLKAIYH